LGKTPSIPRAPIAFPIVSDYDLIRRIGGGAYGEVWLARSKATGVLRAAKVVWRHTFEDERPFRREFEGIQRFERISRELPGQLALYHIGRNDADGYFYYVMELADDLGTATDYSPHTLRTDLAGGRLPAARVLEIGLALAEALGQLHSHGLVHRDVKPSNVIFVNGRPKLADIGLVTDASDQCSIVGTEGYLPPEGPGTPRADIFALGKVLYEAAMGLDRRELPKLPQNLRTWPDAAQVFEINEILLKACANDAGARYANADAMLAELRLLASGKSIKTKRARQWYGAMAGRVAVGLAILGLLAAVVSFLLRGPPPTDYASDGRDSTNELANGFCEKAMLVIRNDNYQEFGEAYTNLHRAIQRDPYFARPYVGLLEFRLRDSQPFVTESLTNLATKLRELGPQLGATATAQAIVSWYDWDFPAAERYALQAIKISPRYELAHTWYGFMLSHWDRPEESRAQLTKSLNIRRSKAIIYRCIGHSYYAERDFTQATNWYQKALELDDHHPQDFWWMASAQWALGHYVTSMNTRKKGDLLDAKNPSVVSSRFVRLREAFDRSGPQGYWEQVRRDSESGPWWLYEKAKIYIELGDTSRALSLLQESFATNEGRGGEGGLPYLLFDECFDGLRDDPQFKKILTNMTFSAVMPARRK
jgi:serine/threonine protein kinase